MEFNIRPVNPSDAKGINQLRIMPGVFENTLAMPSERIKRTEDYINNLDSNSHQFVATIKDEHDNEVIIALGGLGVNASPRLRHSGSIGICVHKDYQNQGVGTKLMATLLDVADNWLMLVRVELGVYTDNERAIALYKKFGFVTEGIKIKAAIRNGQYVDEMIMARIKD
jgi:putative acetyltransferase